MEEEQEAALDDENSGDTKLARKMVAGCLHAAGVSVRRNGG
jgi:hypothetical protein